MKEKLEELIDARGLHAVLDSISEICTEKADQIEDDIPLAVVWHKVGIRIWLLSRNLSERIK